MIQYASGGKESFSGKRVALSGSGNVAQYAALKIIELGGTVISLSDSKGALIATDDKGIDAELINVIADLKLQRKQLTELANSSKYGSKFKWIEGARPWKHCGNVDVALPSATQNEVSDDEAEALIKAGAKFIAEGSNMGCTQEAIDIFEKSRKEKKDQAIWYAPGKLKHAHSMSNHKSSMLTETTQARQPTPVESPSLVSRWHRTRSASSGPRRRSTRSSRTL